MTSEQFAYWLQGFVELNGGAMPTEDQWKSIQDHLQTVFVKVTPVVGPLYAQPATDPFPGIGVRKTLIAAPELFPGESLIDRLNRGEIKAIC